MQLHPKPRAHKSCSFVNMYVIHRSYSLVSDFLMHNIPFVFSTLHLFSIICFAPQASTSKDVYKNSTRL
jgi:hypothetical protein